MGDQRLVELDLSEDTLPRFELVAVEQDHLGGGPGGAEVQMDRIAELQGAGRFGQKGQARVDPRGQLEKTGGGDHGAALQIRALETGQIDRDPLPGPGFLGLVAMDLQFADHPLEVTQSVQDLNHSVPLMRWKRTFVWCYPETTAYSDLPKVKARLKFYSNGVHTKTLYPINAGAID